ncbi:MAG: SDR family NAD(P)-dependent oxidoreductase [Candidatus Binatia bacterium]
MALDGKNAIVTGAASGIGRAIALRLARDGAGVAIFDVDLEGAEKVAAEIRRLERRAIAFRVDVADAESVAAGVAASRRDLGRIQILVNNAGYGEIAPLVHMTEAQWDRMIAVHLKGAFNCTRAVVEEMIAAGWGRIVSTSSVAGLSGAPGFVHYSAAKAGLLGFTRALAQELGATGVTVNAIAPGVIDTPILKKSALTDEMIQRVVDRSPAKRIGRPDDIAAACAYVVSEEASFLMGQVLSPNGGTWF